MDEKRFIQSLGGEGSNQNVHVAASSDWKQGKKGKPGKNLAIPLPPVYLGTHCVIL